MKSGDPLQSGLTPAVSLQKFLLRPYILNSKPGYLVLDWDVIFGTGSLPETLKHTVNCNYTPAAFIIKLFMSVLLMVPSINLKIHKEERG